MLLAAQLITRRRWRARRAVAATTATDFPRDPRWMDAHTLDAAQHCIRHIVGQKREWPHARELTAPSFRSSMPNRCGARWPRMLAAAT